MTCDREKVKHIDKNTRAIVIGTGASGRAAIRLLRHFNAKIRVLDKNAQAIPDDFKAYLEAENIQLVGGEHKPEHFVNCDIVIPSPAAALSTFLPLLPRTHAPEVIAETELASRFVKNEAILAITGTSGKTTTTSLASAMLEKHGFSVFTGGNIGTPFSEYILQRECGGKEADIIVLELSSFQLQTCRTLKPRVGMLLNISENHLDYHKDMREYIDAKMRLFRCQDESDVAIFGADLTALAKKYSLQSRLVAVDGKTQDFNKSNLFGEHNIFNAQAAYKATKEFGVSLKEAQKAVAEFKPIEHRLEKIAEYNDILFINDSKGTTVESLKVALNAFDRPLRLLVGGKFKGGDLEGLVPLVKEKVKEVMLFGASREYFEKAWGNIVPMQYRESLEEAVNEVYAHAEKMM